VAFVGVGGVVPRIPDGRNSGLNILGQGLGSLDWGREVGSTGSRTISLFRYRRDGGWE
jgi:hypothetical protein